MQNKKKIFLIFSQSSYSSGCDYALQTVNFLKKKTKVILVLFGEPFKWRDFFKPNKIKKIFLKKDNLLIIRPFFFIIGNRFQFVRNVNCFINSLFLRLYADILHRRENKIFWFFEPDYADIFLTIFSRFFKIYDCVDFFPSFSEYSKKCHLALAERAEIITANSSVIFDEMKKIRNDVKLVPLGFAEQIFNQARPLPKKLKLILEKHKKKTVLGFVGGISSRLDFKFLNKMIKSSPDLDFLFFGDLEPNVFGQKDNLSKKIDNLQKFPNFYLYPSVEKKFVPSVLINFDIGLIPYNIKNFYNRYSFPMKTMEYLYCGLPIISSEITELKRFSKFIYIVKNLKDFIVVMEHLKKYPISMIEQKKMKKIANSQSWENKVERILKEIEKYNY